MNSAEIVSTRGRELFSYLPAYYESSRIMQSVMGAKGSELDALYQALNEAADQFYVRTATWGLDRWEVELGIPTDRTKPLDQRRAVIESKLRGAGTFTGRLVKNVAEAYDGGTVEVSFQPAEWAFTVQFKDTLGIPPNLADLKAVIEEIKPAHLAVRFEFKYLLIREVDQVMKIHDLEQVLLNKFAGGA
ncbi:YmfQ family protein [Paenibacillus cineris]|uniref:YmfQ family protein n=1 Tax=Paenibacillus cineris TaxID=237530 RepID=UPI001B2E54EC|nr:YmfQ family protein [Paenibacillus cineris]GIO63389.1 hypothetical protein J43TS9_49630 [Paenibacillus cineris]